MSARATIALLVVVAALGSALSAGPSKANSDELVNPCLKVPRSGFEHCMREALKAVIQRDGFENAILQFQRLSTGEYSSLCHPSAHALGGAVRQLHVAGNEIPFNPAMNTCSFGFFHGYVIEIMQQEGGIERAASVCSDMSEEESILNSFPEGECWHGVGNALIDGKFSPDTLSGLLGRARSTCESQTPSTSAYKRCMGGVYNSIGNNYAAARSVEKMISPTLLCGNLTDGTKQICEGYVWIGYFAKTPINEVVESFPAGLSEELKRRIIEGASARLAKRSVYTPVEAVPLCRSLGEPFDTWCIAGFADGLTQLWKVDTKPTQMLAFCASEGLHDEEQHSCLNRALMIISGHVTPSSLPRICASAPAEVRSLCADIVGGGPDDKNAVLTDPNIGIEY